MTSYLCFFQSVIHLPEVLCKEIFADWFAVDPNSLPHLYQVWGAVYKR